jgi:stage IV sporulation protein FB
VNFVLLYLVIAADGIGWLGEATASFLIEINLTLAFFNLLPALPLDGGRILRAAFARSIGFQKATGVAITMAFILSCILLVLGLGALWAGFVQWGMITLGIFLMVSAWQLRRQLQYDTIRFLDTKQRQRLKRPLPVRSIAARADTSLLKVLGQFAPDAYHIVYVINDQASDVRMLMEEELLDYAMRPGSARLKVGDLIS